MTTDRLATLLHDLWYGTTYETGGFSPPTLKALAASLTAAGVGFVDGGLREALDQAVWGFAGEPRRCSRCNCDEGGEHSETCPMPTLLAAAGVGFVGAARPERKNPIRSNFDVGWNAALDAIAAAYTEEN